MAQKVYREDQVLDALDELGGEGLTSAIAGEAELGDIGVLVTLGQLRDTKVAEVEERSRRGNPCWRLLERRPKVKSLTGDRFTPRPQASRRPVKSNEPIKDRFPIRKR